MQVQIAFAHFLGFAIISLLDSSVALPRIDPSELDAITRQKGGIGTGVYCDVRTGFMVLNGHLNDRCSETDVVGRLSVLPGPN